MRITLGLTPKVIRIASDRASVEGSGSGSEEARFKFLNLDMIVLVCKPFDSLSGIRLSLMNRYSGGILSSVNDENLSNSSGVRDSLIRLKSISLGDIIFWNR